MRQIALKDCPKGEFIRRKADAKKTFIRGDYDRTSKKYELTDFEDIGSSVQTRGTTLVWIGFDF
jgi:hypothetical protein